MGIQEIERLLQHSIDDSQLNRIWRAGVEQPETEGFFEVQEPWRKTPRLKNTMPPRRDSLKRAPNQ